MTTPSSSKENLTKDHVDHSGLSDAPANGERPHPNPLRVAMSATSSESPACPSILIVDDNPINLRVSFCRNLACLMLSDEPNF